MRALYDSTPWANAASERPQQVPGQYYVTVKFTVRPDSEHFRARFTVTSLSGLLTVNRSRFFLSRQGFWQGRYSHCQSLSDAPDSVRSLSVIPPLLRGGE
jgi:hypothetical protein